MNIFAQDLKFVPANELQPITVKTMIGDKKPKWYRECSRCHLDHAHAAVWVFEKGVDKSGHPGRWVKRNVCPKCYVYMEDNKLFSATMDQAQAQSANYIGSDHVPQHRVPYSRNSPNSKYVAFYKKIE
jgi:hypothetical protein